MDQSFFLRAKRLLEQRPPLRIDHRELVETARAQQAASPTAAAALRAAPAADGEAGTGNLCTLLLGEEGWRRAVLKQGGCFNRAGAARRINRP